MKSHTLALFVYCVIIFFGLLSCSNNDTNSSLDNWRNYSRAKVEQIINRKFSLPNQIPKMYPDSATIYELMSKKAKVLYSVDIGCSACLSKFSYWKSFTDQFKVKYGIDAPIIAVVFAPRCDDITVQYISRLCGNAWIYDPEGDFTFENDIDDDRFQALLIDSKDTIRIVGNPMHNEALGKLYEKKLFELLN